MLFKAQSSPNTHNRFGEYQYDLWGDSPNYKLSDSSNTTEKQVPHNPLLTRERFRVKPAYHPLIIRFSFAQAMHLGSNRK